MFYSFNHAQFVSKTFDFRELKKKKTQIVISFFFVDKSSVDKNRNLKVKLILPSHTSFWIFILLSIGGAFSTFAHYWRLFSLFLVVILNYMVFNIALTGTRLNTNI